MPDFVLQRDCFVGFQPRRKGLNHARLQPMKVHASFSFLQGGHGGVRTVDPLDRPLLATALAGMSNTMQWQNALCLYKSLESFANLLCATHVITRE